MASLILRRRAAHGEPALHLGHEFPTQPAVTAPRSSVLPRGYAPASLLLHRTRVESLLLADPEPEVTNGAARARRPEDGVRWYFGEIGKVSLLTADQEVGTGLRPSAPDLLERFVENLQRQGA